MKNISIAFVALLLGSACQGELVAYGEAEADDQNSALASGRATSVAANPVVPVAKDEPATGDEEITPAPLPAETPPAPEDVQPGCEELAYGDSTAGVEVSYEVHGAYTSGEKLVATMIYGGGCAPHDFGLVWDYAFLGTGTPRALGSPSPMTTTTTGAAPSWPRTSPMTCTPSPTRTARCTTRPTAPSSSRSSAPAPPSPSFSDGVMRAGGIYFRQPGEVWTI